MGCRDSHAKDAYSLCNELVGYYFLLLTLSLSLTTRKNSDENEMFDRLYG